MENNQCYFCERVLDDLDEHNLCPICVKNKGTCTDCSTENMVLRKGLYQECGYLKNINHIAGNVYV